MYDMALPLLLLHNLFKEGLYRCYSAVIIWLTEEEQYMNMSAN